MIHKILFICLVILVSWSVYGDGGEPGDPIPYVSADPTIFVVDRFNKQYSFNVTSNTSWIISSDVSWINTINPSAFRGNRNVTFVVDYNNNETSKRIGVITVVATGGDTEVIYVQQNATPSISEMFDFDVTPIFDTFPEHIWSSYRTSILISITPTGYTRTGTFLSNPNVTWVVGDTETTLNTKPIAYRGTTGTITYNVSPSASLVSGSTSSTGYEIYLTMLKPITSYGLSEVSYTVKISGVSNLHRGTSRSIHYGSGIPKPSLFIPVSYTSDYGVVFLGQLESSKIGTHSPDYALISSGRIPYRRR